MVATDLGNNAVQTDFQLQLLEGNSVSHRTLNNNRKEETYRFVELILG
jgi:hypothetical protein